MVLSVTRYPVFSFFRVYPHLPMKRGFPCVVALVLFVVVCCVPFSASATTVEGSIEVDSLSGASSKPTISGTASGTKTVRVTIRKAGSKKVLFKSKAIKVKNGMWEVKVSKKLAKGTYDVGVVGAPVTTIPTVTSGTLTVGKGAKVTTTTTTTAAQTTLVVAPVPLLAGGIVQAGMSVPVSYLQINNIGTTTAHLRGFWVRQDGSANVASVIGLTTVDDQGGSRGSAGGIEGFTPFAGGMAFAPTDALFASGQMRLFTIKAVMSANVFPYYGGQLKINVVLLDSDAKIQGAFPIVGTIWTIQ